VLRQTVIAVSELLAKKLNLFSEAIYLQRIHGYFGSDILLLIDHCRKSINDY
jgi:hypothetical protein